MVRCPEDVHATGRTRLLPLEPGAQAAVDKTTRRYVGAEGFKDLETCCDFFGIIIDAAVSETTRSLTGRSECAFHTRSIKSRTTD